MNPSISCPACNAPITASQLFYTGTLFRFKCPHCVTRLQPKDRTFATGWMAIAGVLGVLIGVASVPIVRFVPAGMPRILSVVGLIVLSAAAIAVIKWRASLALIAKTELRIAP